MPPWCPGWLAWASPLAPRRRWPPNLTTAARSERLSSGQVVGVWPLPAWRLRAWAALATGNFRLLRGASGAGVSGTPAVWPPVAGRAVSKAPTAPDEASDVADG